MLMNSVIHDNPLYWNWRLFRIHNAFVFFIVCRFRNSCHYDVDPYYLLIPRIQRWVKPLVIVCRFYFRSFNTTTYNLYFLPGFFLIPGYFFLWVKPEKPEKHET